MKMKKTVSAIAALAMASSVFAGFATVASADDTYEILYGTSVTDDNGAITGVAAQTDFTGDENEVTGIAFVDANNNSIFNMEGSALNIPKGSSWSKNFSSPVTTGKVYFSAVYSVSANNVPGNITLVDSSGNTIFASASNNSKNNAVQPVATICGTDLTNYVRLPRTAGYKFEICVDVDAKSVEYTIPVSSGNRTYSTLTGSVTLTSTDVAGMTITSSNWGATMDNVYLYSVVGDEVKYDYTVNYICDENTVKTTSGKTAADTVITAESKVEDSDGNVYYITAAEAPTMTISSTGENVLNVPVRAAYQYTTTVTAKYGEDSSAVVHTTTIEENKTATYYYPKYAKNNDKWYVIDADTSSSAGYYAKTLAPTEDNANYDVTYSAYENSDKVVYYAEVEDIADGTAGAYPGRYSNGGAIKGATATTDELAAGVYTVYVGARNGSSSVTAYATVSAGEQSVDTVEWTTGQVTENSVEITLSEASALTIAASSTNLEADYILITKTGDVEPTKTYPEVTVTDIGTFTNEGSDPAAAFKGTFTVGENNYVVNGVQWKVVNGDVTKTENCALGTVASGDGEIVVGLIVSGIGADTIATPTATTYWAN